MKIRPSLQGFALLLASLATSPAAFSAVVTSPAGMLTHTGIGASSDTLAANTWLRRNVRDGSAVGISTTYANGGNGSFEFSGTSSTSKADIEYYSDFGTLAGFTTASFDWYRDSSSTVTGNLHPVIRLLYDNDGNIATEGDQGALVFEIAYNTPGSVPENTWVTSTVNLSSIVWQVSYGNGVNEIYSRTVSDWTSYTQGVTEFNTGQDALSGTTRIIGLSLGFGSGWNGQFAGAVDNISFSSSSPGATSLSATNFEVVPEPTSALLGALGSLFLLRRRRVTP